MTEVAMKICRDGRGGSGNGDRFATVIDGGGSELEDGGGGVGGGDGSTVGSVDADEKTDGVGFEG